MARRRPIGKKLLKSLLPILALLVLVVVVATGWIVYDATRPPRHAYLVTPESFNQISGPGLKASDESWRNRDGSQARGWLLRGAEGTPAVVLLHRYGADRSYLFNLGVKLYETTNFTILWPDLRGHGLNPPVTWTSFGSRESDDVLAALDYLKSLKTRNGKMLVSDRIGLYGVELGAYAAMRAAPQIAGVKVLVLDSVPAAPDELLHAAVKEDLGLDNGAVQYLAQVGTRVYFLGIYNDTPACGLATSLTGQRVLLLSGEGAGYLRESTASLSRCFPNPANVEVKTDLPLTGYQQPTATGEQGEDYDRRVINFFDKALRGQ
jgi:pimeloyl-ACP methyl ester carboxylesterase